MQEDTIPLHKIKFGSAEILSIDSPDKELANRLRELGMTKGSRIKIHGRAPLGDPMILSVRGCRFALRGKDAQHIRVIAR